MKQTIKTVFTFLLLLTPIELWAQYYWAMAVLEKGNEKPTIMEFHSTAENAENGIEYYRIYDDGFRFRHEDYNPIKLQYGFRWANRQLFIFDFENKKETLAFDFNLSSGAHFTTFNGIEWEVVSAKDTLVNISFCGRGESVSKRLLVVKSIDGCLSDQWLEDFGSFSNHFMIMSQDNVEFSHTLWMEYEMGEYLAREINADPLFAHDSGWMDETDDFSSDNYSRCIYENGCVIFENARRSYEHRDYCCFYRVGDDIFNVYKWDMEPHIDGGTLAIRKDIISFYGLPTPASGNYTIHIDNREYTSSISIFSSFNQSKSSVYDLQGRRLQGKPLKGVYIQGGKKRVVK